MVRLGAAASALGWKMAQKLESRIRLPGRRAGPVPVELGVAVGVTVGVSSAVAEALGMATASDSATVTGCPRHRRRRVVGTGVGGPSGRRWRRGRRWLGVESASESELAYLLAWVSVCPMALA